MIVDGGRAVDSRQSKVERKSQSDQPEAMARLVSGLGERARLLDRGGSSDGGTRGPGRFRVSADSAGFEVVCFHTHLQVQIPKGLERCLVACWPGCRLVVVIGRRKNDWVRWCRSGQAGAQQCCAPTNFVVTAFRQFAFGNW